MFRLQWHISSNNRRNFRLTEFRMTSAALLFLPFPPAKSTISNDTAFQNLLKEKAQTAKECAMKTKGEYRDPTSFRTYMKLLERAQNAVFDSVWHSPFKSAEVYPSRRSETELAGTIWNFIAYTHNQILELNTQDPQDLRIIRQMLQDCLAATKNFKSIAENIDHPVFNAKLGSFIEVYHDYLTSIWTLNCAITSPKIQNKLCARIAHRCLTDVDRCKVCARALEKTSKTFWIPVLESMAVYFTGFARLYMGKSCYDSKDYGIALAHYRAGAGAVERVGELSYAPMINTSAKMIRDAVMNARKALEHENATVWYDGVPSDCPPLPPPTPPQKIQPDPEILFGGFTQTTIIPPMPESSTPEPVTTYAPPPLPPATVQPPAPEASVPPTYEPVDFGTTIIPPPAPPPVDTEFPEWEAIKMLKRQLRDRLNAVIQGKNTKLSAIAQQLAQHMDIAEGPDGTIQEAINQYHRNPESAAKDAIMGMLPQPQEFYTNLEIRLNRLEATGE